MRYAAFIRKFLKVDTENGEEFKCFCPIHKNSRTPSFAINASSGYWKCFSRCGGGDIALLCKRANLPLPEEADLSNPIGGKEDDDRIVPEEVVKALQKELWKQKNKEARDYFRARGISDEVLKKHEIGYNADTARITIPIRDAAGKCRNVKYYDWLHTQRDKFLSYGPGFGGIRLFPASVFNEPDNNRILLLEGEPDVLLAHSLGIEYAVCATGGAGNWDPAFSRLFEGKNVLILYDIDEAGRNGAGAVARSLRLFASSVTVGELPISEPANGDFTDFVKSRDFRRDFVAGFLDKLDPLQKEAPSRGVATLNNVVESKFFRKSVKFRAVVQGKDMTPYQVPKTVRITCPSQKAKQCADCPVKGVGGEVGVDIPIESRPVLCAIDSTDSTVEESVRKYLEIPAGCRSLHIQEEVTVPLWQVILGNDLDADAAENNYVLRPAFVREDLLANTPYEFTTMAVKSPKTQESMLLCLSALPSQTSLETWNLTGKEALLKLWEA
jgi:hypothetical protein